MSEIYIISDPHFRHKNVISFAKRPFTDIENMEESMISLWNTIVSKRDTVICLGDWGWGIESYKIADRLNGMIRLVMGNHDRGDPHILAKHFHSIHGSLQKYDMLLTHIPVLLDKWHTWKYVVHGHYHSSAENLPDRRYYNANMDAQGFYGPIPFEVIRAELKRREVEERLNGGYDEFQKDVVKF